MAGVATTISGAATELVNRLHNSSLSRVIVGTDKVFHNLIDGAARRAVVSEVERRGYQYRAFSGSAEVPVLTPSMQQVAKPSIDVRNTKLERDAVSLIERVADTADALKTLPDLSSLGAVRLRVVTSVPAHLYLRGYSPVECTLAEETQGPLNPPLSRTASEVAHQIHDVDGAAHDIALVQDSKIQSTIVLVKHLQQYLFLVSEGDLSTRTFEAWIRKCHPENVRDGVIDPRLFIVGSVHLRVWLEVTRDRKDCFQDPRGFGHSHRSDPHGILPPAGQRSIPSGGGLRELLEDSSAEEDVSDSNDSDNPEDDDLPDLEPLPGDWHGGHWLKEQVRPKPDISMLGSERVGACDPTQFVPLLPCEGPSVVTVTTRVTQREVPVVEPFGCGSLPIGHGVRVMKRKMRWLASAVTPTRKNRYVKLAEDVIDVANPLGVRELFISDVALPTAVYSSCLEAADALIGEDKAAKQVAIQKVLRKLKREISGKFDQQDYHFLQSVTTLVICAQMLNLGEDGRKHIHVLGYFGTPAKYIDFFANTHIESSMEVLSAAKEKSGLKDIGILYGVPAPAFPGKLNEDMVFYEKEALGDYELKERPHVLSCVQTGSDLFGKAPPCDHKNPLTLISGLYRHLGDKDAVVCEGTPYEFVIHLDHSERARLGPSHERVWNDMIEDDVADMIEILSSKDSKFDFDFLTDGKPGSYSQEATEEWLAKQMSDEAFFAEDNALTQLLRASKHAEPVLNAYLAGHDKKKPPPIQKLRASANPKKHEELLVDGSEKSARLVISPGVMGSEALHQVRRAPLIKALEALHGVTKNHTNLKGLNEDTKRIKLAEYLRAMPKGAIVFGTDKSKNDSCFREPVWRKCVQYLARMADVFEEHLYTRSYTYSPDEASDHVAHSFPKGTLDLKYWVVRMTPLLAFLLSGIGETGFINRKESTVERGVATLDAFGEEAYAKYRKSVRMGSISTHPKWDQYPLPHIADFVPFEHLTHKLVEDITVPADKQVEDKIVTRVAGVEEGDDQIHGLVKPQNAEWKNLGPRDVANKWTSQLSKSTKFIFEAALPCEDDELMGRSAIFEMLSAWCGLPKGAASNTYEVCVIVPKPLKALRKLAYSNLSSEHTVLYDEDEKPIGVEKNAKYWALGLTRYYSLALVNRESLGVRWLFTMHGDFCFQCLADLIGAEKARGFGTIYGDRTPERKQLEEASSTIYRYCGEMREDCHEVLNKVDPHRVLPIVISAWRNDLHALRQFKKEEVGESLLAFDDCARNIQVSKSMLLDPMLLWGELRDIGVILKPLVDNATANHIAVAKLYRKDAMTADSWEIVKLARAAAGSKSHTNPLVQGSDTSAPSKGKGKQAGKHEQANGYWGTHSDDRWAWKWNSGKGKDKGKGKGKDNKGSGVAVAPEVVDAADASRGKGAFRKANAPPDSTLTTSTFVGKRW